MIINDTDITDLFNINSDNANIQSVTSDYINSNHVTTRSLNLEMSSITVGRTTCVTDSSGNIHNIMDILNNSAQISKLLRALNDRVTILETELEYTKKIAGL